MTDWTLSEDYLLEGNLSPEEELVVALIRQAYQDLHSGEERLWRSAATFFASAFFRELADLLGLSEATRRRLVK